MTDPVNWETVNALIEATAEAREVIRQAHEATKDLRQVVTEAKAFIARDIEADIKAQVHEQITALGEATAKAMEKSVEKVGKEFERLEAIYLGKDRRARREGVLPLEEVLRRSP